MATTINKQPVQKKLKSNTKPFYKVVVWAFRVALLIAAFVLLNDRSAYIKAIEQNDKVLSYTIEGRSITSDSKSRHYNMRILYNNERYEVSLTRQEYNDIQLGKHPELYYVRSKNAVIVPWEVRSNLNLAITSVVFFFASFLPVQKIEEKILNSQKPSWLKFRI